MGTAGIAFGDLSRSIRRLPLALTLALDDIAGKYRRTALGPLWLVIGQAATIGGMLVVFGSLFGMDPRVYVVYLAAGLPTWVLVSSFLTDMPSTFIAARGLMESYDVPWLLHVWRRAVGYVLTFFHQILTLIVLMIALQIPFTLNMLYVFPALLVILVAGAGFGLLVAVVNARYRDLEPTLGVLASFLFLLSPVMWRVEQLNLNQWIVHWNPLHYYITIVRDPLLGRVPPQEYWLGTSCAAVAIFFIGFGVFMMSRRRIYHWL